MLQNLSVDEVMLRALALAQGLKPTASNISRVAATVGPEAARWAFTQTELRERARDRFAKADSMLFDRDGLEMSSHERVATYHASLFPPGVLVADLTVGIGADLIALAKRGPSIGFEVDQTRALLATHNLKVHEAEAPVRVADSLSEDWPFLYALADPARRSGGRKRLDPADYQPNLETLVERMSKLRLGVIKLSPMMPDEALRELGGAVQFVSFGGECRESLVVLGSEVQIDNPVAVHIESRSTLSASSEGFSAPLPRSWFYEADPAAIRVGGLGTLCKEHSLDLLGDSNGYLTGDESVDSPWLRRYEVLYCGTGDIAATKRELRDRNCATPDVKTRGKGLNSEALRKQWRLNGSEHVQVAVYRVGPKIKHAILRRS
ncbi:MAG TPA: hypothetical protein PKA27_04730 [Fimbriimonadaceae bacterium]|nr:hypothetical protein [Fimbriimonadaceae bacterium]